MKLRTAALVLVGLLAVGSPTFAAGGAGGVAAGGAGGGAGGATSDGAGGQAVSAKGLAVGFFLGEPTGITLRWGIGARQSIEAKAAWSFSGATGQGANVIFQGNFLTESPGTLVIKGEDFPLYFGLGAETRLGDHFNLSVRVPAGVMYRFGRVPIELCLEFGLGMQLFPSTVFVGSGGVGLRYRL